jgi:hypothetical protein
VARRAGDGPTGRLFLSRPFRIASMTCGGRGLPLIAAAIFARRPGEDSAGSAAVRAAARCGAWTSLLSLAVPSVITPTPSARRHELTVPAVTPHQWATALADSRPSASTRSP